MTGRPLLNEEKQMKLQTKAGTAFDRINHILAILAAFLLAFIMLSVCSDVIMRYFFSRPMLWVTEVTEYCLLWVTFLATAWVLSRDNHVVMDLVIGHMKPEIRARMGIMTSIIGIAICLLITWYGAKVTLDVFQRDLLLSTVLTPPAYILFIIIPIGSFLLTIQFIRRAFHYIQTRGVPAIKETKEDESLTQAMR